MSNCERLRSAAIENKNILRLTDDSAIKSNMLTWYDVEVEAVNNNGFSKQDRIQLQYRKGKMN